jgi:GGDEF domain-containing protein
MTDARFYDATSGLLTREAFSFMLDHQLKHAHRAQEFLTLVVFVVERRWRELVVDREWRDLAVAADEWIVKEIGRLMRVAVRNTDLLARSGEGAISLLLVGVNRERALGVIERLNQHLRRYRGTPTLHINVGAACCPTDGVHADELRATAARRAASADAIRCLGPVDESPRPREGNVLALPLPKHEDLPQPVPVVERRRGIGNQKTIRDN